jgi:peptidyl-dipeptidase Dcp
MKYTQEGRKMKKLLIVIGLVGLSIWSCSQKTQNPFFVEWDTPFGTPPFGEIKVEHYLPAIKQGTAEESADIEAIISNPEAPNFENTIHALDQAGSLLRTVNGVFDNMQSANTSDELQEVAKTVSPLLSKQSDDILLNEALFGRIRAVYEQRDELDLTPEELKILESYYKDFTRNGANLSAEDKQILREINKELALLTLQFGENVLKETNTFQLIIENEADLAGLPENVIQGAAEDARQLGHPGKWIFTLHKPSLIPFLQYSERRDLREKMFKAFINQGNNNNEYDNKKILTRIVALRIKRANLLGYKTHADFVLEEYMAKEPAKVYDLLNKLWEPALNRAKSEVQAMQALIDEEGGDFRLQPWDWWYYAEKLKKTKYSLDEELLKPYFKLENVRSGAFELVHRLYGITLEKRSDIPVYHPDVEVFEVKDADGSHIGILYTDYFPRTSKRGGAWMNAYRKEYYQDGQRVGPIVCNVGNFTKPTSETPSLLSIDDVKTLFHEFGHGLHGLLSDCQYYKLSGTSVPYDFVELPSQIMENWVTEPEMLKIYARHYQTDEPIPDELVQKLRASALFNQGFETVELLASSFLDMDWHTLTAVTDSEVLEFEKQSMDRIGLIPEIVPRWRSTYFRHIFSGEYSSGYYSYTWAEVLDADAFQAFKENGLFDRKTGESFRKNILSRGGTVDPMLLYVQFRGKEPSIEPLLDRRGLR